MPPSNAVVPTCARRRPVLRQGSSIESMISTDGASANAPASDAADPAPAAVCARHPPMLRQGSSSQSGITAEPSADDEHEHFHEVIDESEPLLSADQKGAGMTVLQRRWRAARRREYAKATAAAGRGTMASGRSTQQGSGGRDEEPWWETGIVMGLTCCIITIAVVLWIGGSLGTILYALMWYHNVTTTEMLDDFHRTRAHNLAQRS